MIELINASDLIDIHDQVLHTTGVGLPGLAGDKDLEGMLARVENRIRYELSDDL